MNKEPDRSQRKALGKGLSALLPNRSNAAEQKPTPPPVNQAAQEPKRGSLPEYFEEFQNVPLEQIQPSNDQPRGSFDDEKLEELSQSIRAHGVIQPITVQRVDTGQYRIVAGERRWRAAKLAGLTEIPALFRRVPQQDLLELALIENIQREDLNPIEVAAAFQRLNVEHHLSHEQIAERTGKDRSTVTNFLRLLKLSPPVRHELATGGISMGHARALLNVDPDRQALLCSDIKTKQLSVRETEALVRKLTEPPRKSLQTAETKEVIDPNVRAAIEEMAMALGTRVRLHARSETSGRLEIEYYSQEDLDRIYSVIVK
jgi:ParB family transcriptional regulator, chromosome partitioning protein